MKDTIVVVYFTNENSVELAEMSASYFKKYSKDLKINIVSNKIPEDYACPLCKKTHLNYKNSGRYWTQSPFSVDHCQKTRVVRGWICNPCNSAMGLAQHNPDLLKKMANYLERK